MGKVVGIYAYGSNLANINHSPIGSNIQKEYILRKKLNFMIYKLIYKWI
jgi:hypothetical protein